MTPRKLRINKKLLVIAGAIVLVMLIGACTFGVLCQLKPTGLRPQSGQGSQTTSTVSGEDARKQAEKYLKAGNLPQAKNAYQTAYDRYTTEGNPAAAADAKIQIEIINAKLTAQNKAPTTSP